MKTKLKPQWRRLLRVLSDGGWYTRVIFPTTCRVISERVVNACIDQGLVRTKRKVIKRETSQSPELYIIAIRITVRGKKALAAGKY